MAIVMLINKLLTHELKCTNKYTKTDIEFFFFFFFSLGELIFLTVPETRRNHIYFPGVVGRQRVGVRGGEWGSEGMNMNVWLGEGGAKGR